MFAAYVVALQALLLPLSVAVGSPLDLNLCAAASSVDSSQAPASHQSGSPCAAGCGMQCAIHALAGPPQISVAYMQVGPRLVAASPLLVEAIIRPIVRGPQSPRPPPAA